ncbi:MAG: glycerol kinase [Acidobacteriota bacterium]|nr:glycerol kinase [Acidobacteriota bacterium]
MAGDCILAIDQGTTNTKGLLFDRVGNAIFKTVSSVSLIQPRPGYIEQDPLGLWRSTLDVMRACAAFAEEAGTKIAGIAISNQRETAVAWRPVKGSGAAGPPVCNAISWQCRRSEPVCEALRDFAGLLQDRTGLPLDPLLSATKWKWLLDEQPSLRVEAEHGKMLLGTVDSWLLYNLTQGQAHATDLTNASRVALLNLESLDWDDELLALFQIPRQALPTPRASSGSFGMCSAVPELAGVPVVAMIGDSHAAMVGHGRYEAGSVKATYGTGSSLMMLTPGLAKAQKSLARTIAWSLPGQVQYALEGNIAMSGAAVHWVGEFLGLPHPADDAAVLAETVPDAGGAILVPAMVGLGAPYWDSAARGLITNLERAHTGAHLARAALDAIAMQVADVLEAMGAAAGVETPVLLADGGATRNRTLMQMQADVLHHRVRRSTQEELSARGAALLGGLALGWWKSMEEVAEFHLEGDWFEPMMAETERLAMREQWRLAISRARLRKPMIESAGI